ncbi:hypothetical protein B0A52_05081 [Exophiala mesophila]|uniref:FAD dependent oxidoreductase domain-containing protein n=1 Tax=Exophiala mesophila TaxID=212818 RepID=A0A438N6X8_EXOME|nr:hypothetical protein B0A52_05081 [Exophiala mesophila]
MDHQATIPPGLPRDHPVQSYWQDPPDAIADHRTSPDLPSQADIVIIGSGISGATIAYNLLSADPTLNIVLLEARQAASGASGRNGGHTKTASYRSFADNVKSVGTQDATRIAHLEYNCMVAIHDFIKTNNLDCDSKRCQTVDVFYDPVQWKAAQESVALMDELMGSSAPKHTFHTPAETSSKFLAQTPLGSLEYESGSLSAYKLTISILKLALSMNLNLQTNTPVNSIVKSPSTGEWQTTTPRGTISSKKLILATNGYTAHLYPPLQGVIVPLRGVVTAQRPGQNMPQQGLPTTFSFIYPTGFDYMITRPAGTTHEGDIIIGGGLPYAANNGVSEYGNTDDGAYDEGSASYLLDTTRQFFGSANWGSDHPEGHAQKIWSGIMGFSADGYPFVGPVPGEQGLFLDVSFQGHGMVLCFLCARALADMVLGKDDGLPEWFPNTYRVTEERLRKRFTGRV